MKDFMQSKLPEIIINNNRQKIFDPIRKKFVNVKPEENVRQHLISFLIDELKIQKNLICVEEHLSHYGINSDERADIIVNYYDDETDTYYPLLVIECKAPEIFLSDQAREQLFGYAEKLGNEYCWLTNGEENYFYYREDDEFIEIEELPNYKEMLGGEYTPAPVEEFESRAEFDELEEKYFDYVNEGNIGEDTPKNLSIPMTNFLECLMDTEHKFPAKQYKIFRVIEDFDELRNLTVGNAGSESFSGLHRSFDIEYNGDKKIVSFLVSSYWNESKPDISRTTINVAIDKENYSHNSLELVVDRNFVTYDKKIRFLHDGRITCGNKGALKVDGLRRLVSEKFPEIIYGEKCYLGTLINNRLWYLDDPEIMKVVENLISYALIRDDYRAMS